MEELLRWYFPRVADEEAVVGPDGQTVGFLQSVDRHLEVFLREHPPRERQPGEAEELVSSEEVMAQLRRIHVAEYGEEPTWPR